MVCSKLAIQFFAPKHGPPCVIFFLSMLRAWVVLNCLIWELWVRVKVLGSGCNNRFPNTHHNLNHNSNDNLILNRKSNPKLTLTLTLY